MADLAESPQPIVKNFTLACASEGAPFGYMVSGKPRKRPTVAQAKQLEKHGVDWQTLNPGVKPPRRQTEEHKEKAMINLNKARERGDMIREKKRELMIKAYGEDWAKSHTLKELTSQEALTGEILPRTFVAVSQDHPEPPPPTVRAAARLSEAKKVPSLGALVDIVGNLIADVRESRNAADEVKELVKTEASERAQRKAEKAARMQSEKEARAKLEADEREQTEKANKLKTEEDNRKKMQIIEEQDQQHKKILKNGKIW